MKINPAEWQPLPDDDEIRKYVTECLDGKNGGQRLEIVETDYGWAVRATIPTAGAVSSVSQNFMLTGDMDSRWMQMAHVFEELEEVMIWRAGIGLSVEVDLPDDPTVEDVSAAMMGALDKIAPTS